MPNICTILDYLTSALKKYAMQIFATFTCTRTHAHMRIETPISGRKLHCAASVHSDAGVSCRQRTTAATAAAAQSHTPHEMFSLTLSRLHIARVLCSSFCHELELHVEGVQVFSTAHCLVAGVLHCFCVRVHKEAVRLFSTPSTAGNAQLSLSLCACVCVCVCINCMCSE